MGDPDQVVAIGLLTERDLSVLGEGFHRAYPISRTDAFNELLREIDRAEQARTGGRRPDGYRLF